MKGVKATNFGSESCPKGTFIAEQLQLRSQVNFYDLSTLSIISNPYNIRTRNYFRIIYNKIEAQEE